MSKKPRLGQNFLVDADACGRVAAALGNLAQEAVLEIGPGQGAITRRLTKTVAHLDLVEFDDALAASLSEEYASAAAIEVLHADILALDITSLSHRRGRKLIVVGNLPYYITSDILLHLVAHHAAIDRAVLMVQREVAERITASPRTRDYGVLSATMQLHGSQELLFTLPPSAFLPPPEVYSSVFRWHVEPRFVELGISAESFVPFLRVSFAQKRKTWANNLRNAGYTTAAINAAFAASGVEPGVRAEAVDLSAMAAVFHQLQQAS